MSVEVVLRIVIAGPRDESSTSAWLRLEMPCAPFPGLQIQQPVWSEPRAVKTVIYDVGDQDFEATLESDRSATTRADYERVVKMYERHDWDVQG